MSKNKHRQHDEPVADLGPAPAAFIEELLHGPASNRARPALGRAFNVHHGPEWSRELMTFALGRVVDLTSAQVGFVFDEPGRPVEIEFRLDPNDPGVLGVGGLAATSAHVSGNTIVGGLVVLAYLDGWGVHWPDSAQVIMHEVGHLLGLGHSSEAFNYAGPRIMGGAQWDQLQFHPWEREAWAAKAALPLGTRSAAAQAQITVVCPPPLGGG